MTDSYNKQTAGVLMTLAGLAYVDAGHNLSRLKVALVEALACADYATRGDWRLVWGPVLHGDGDNLAYLVRSATTGAYALVLRGTVQALGSIWEDVPTGQHHFPYVDDPEAKVSAHFLSAQQALLSATDPDSLVTLGEYLAAEAQGGTLYVTGHSQGGGLVPMFVAWAQHQSKVLGLNLSVAGYGFAPPTSGNPAFARWVGRNSACFQVINPLDVVPFGYAGIGDIIRDHVPERVPVEYHPLIDAAALAAREAGHWQQPDTRVLLDKVQLPSSVGYLAQVGAQHNHNSYLYLLGAPQTHGDPSILPNYRTG